MPTRPAERRAQLESVFLSSLPLIENTVQFVARRNRLNDAERDDFAAEVKLALIDNDYAVLARFEGQSSLRSYLAVVVQRLFIDSRRRLWGKWRPSAAAQQRGPVALRLEALLYRDRLSLAEAIEVLRTNVGVAESRDELAAMADALPPRLDRRPAAGDDVLEDVPAGELANPETQVEGERTARRAQELVGEVMESLPAQDRVVLRLRFEDDVSVADIARLLKVDQKRLYRRIDGLLSTFRRALEARGLGWPEVRQMIERGQCHLRLPPCPGETAPAGPSLQERQL